MLNLHGFWSPSCEAVCARCGVRDLDATYLVLWDGLDALEQRRDNGAYCASCLLGLYMPHPAMDGQVIARIEQPPFALNGCGCEGCVIGCDCNRCDD